MGDVPVLSEGRFACIAALVSPFGLQLTLIARGNGFNGISSYEFGAKTLQLDPDRNVVVVSTVAKLRNHTLQFDSVSYYHFFPTTGAPLSRMPESKAADAVTPVAVQMLP